MRCRFRQHLHNSELRLVKIHHKKTRLAGFFFIRRYPRSTQVLKGLSTLRFGI